MSRTRLAPKAPATAVPRSLNSDTLADFLHTVEDRCNRAVAVINAAARAVGGDALDLYQNDDTQTLVSSSLERIAEELATISDKALKARVTRVYD